MSKKAFPVLPPQILAVISNYRPETATHYRLKDSQQRLFPPLGQPAYMAFPRVEVPMVPTAKYSIRYETGDGTIVPRAEGEDLPEVEIGVDSEVLASPMDIEVYNERNWQKAQKRENRYRRDAINNEGHHALMALLVESHQTILGFAKQQAEIAKEFSNGQKALLEQQNALFEQQRNMQPPHREDWSGTVKAVINAIADVTKTGMTAEAVRRMESPRVREALAKDRTQSLPSPETPPKAAETAKPHSPPPSAKAEAPPPPAPEAPKPGTEPPPPAPSSETASTPPTQEGQKSTESLKREEAEEAQGMVSPWVSAWREIKRRIVSITGEGIAFILSSPENFVDFCEYVTEPCPHRVALAESPA